MSTRYDILIEANDKASKQIKAINVALKNTDTRATKAAKSMKSMGSSLAKVGFKTATTGIKGLAAATVAASAAFVVFGTKSINALDNLGKLSTKLGVSTKFLSEYSSVARMAGISTDQFTTGIQRFQRRLGEAQMGTGELLKPLKALGISMKDTNGNFRDGESVFQDYIAALGQMTNEQQALAFATKGFDMEGAAFINIAKMGTDQINKFKQAARDAGLVVDDKLVKAAEDAKDAIGRLTDIGRGFGLQFFGNLAAPLRKFTDDLRDKINEAVKGAGGMEQFSKKLASQFLSAAANTLEAFTKLFEGFANTMRILGNVVKITLSKIPSTFTGGKQYAIFEEGQKSVEAYKKELESAIKVRDDLAAKEKAYLETRKWWQGRGDRDNPVMGFGRNGMPMNQLMAVNGEIIRIQEKIEELENTEFLNISTESVNLFEGSIGDAILKLREMAAEMAKPTPIAPRTPGDHHPDGPTQPSNVQTQIEIAAIDALINKYKKLQPIQAQLTERYNNLRTTISELNVGLASNSAATDTQRAALEQLVAAATEEKNILYSRIKMGETVNSVYEASVGALQRLKTEETDLTSAIEQTVFQMKSEQFQTETNRTFLKALQEQLKANQEAQQRLTGTYVEAQKPLETLTEYIKRIMEQSAIATNETNNYNAALKQMQLDLIAGRGNALELAAAIKFLTDQQEKGNKPTLTVAEDAAQRLQDLKDELEYTPQLVEELKKLGATREQLLALGVAEETDLESAIKRLELYRQEQEMAPGILKYLQDKLNLTKEEAEALGLVNEAKDKELSASEQAVKQLAETNARYQNIEATLKNQSAIQALADKYGVAAEDIRKALTKIMEGVEKLEFDTTTIAGNIASVWDQMGKDMASGIAQGIMRGEGLFNSFTGFLKNFANRVITQIIEKMLVQPMINQMMQFGGSLFGGMGGGIGGMSGGGNGFAGIISSIFSGFAGGFANGGHIPGGKFGIVGEEGPEYISGPANITPMNAGLNTNEGLTVNFNINAISTQDGTAFILEHKKEITGVIQNAYNKRGKEGIY